MMSAAVDAGKLCTAQFHAGEWHILHGNRAEAAKHLQAAAETCDKISSEYVTAATELKRLNP